MRSGLLQSLSISLMISGFLIFGSSQIVFADIIIDLDGIASPGLGSAVDQQVSPGDPLQSWPAPAMVPLPPSGQRAGIDWVDLNQRPQKEWSDGDALFSEDEDLCFPPNPPPGPAIRNQQYDLNKDCIILEDPLNPIPDAFLTDCDLESGGSPSGHLPIFPCQDTRPNVQLAFHDINGNGFWNNGEDIVLDFLPFGTFEPQVTVGGKQIPIDTSTLVLAGTQFTTSWLIPALVAAIGIGLVIARKI